MKAAVYTKYGSIEFKPANLSFEEAAGINFGGTTALHRL